MKNFVKIQEQKNGGISEIFQEEEFLEVLKALSEEINGKRAKVKKCAVEAFVLLKNKIFLNGVPWHDKPKDSTKLDFMDYLS